MQGPLELPCVHAESENHKNCSAVGCSLIPEYVVYWCGSNVSDFLRRPLSEMTNYVYILACADGTFYTGWTTHLEQRVETHNQGRGAKYTRSRRPVKLLYWEEYSDKGEALRREAAIKKMTRKQKEELVGRNF